MQRVVVSADAPQSPRRRRRGRVPVDALAHEGLFLLLTNLRAANATSLFRLFFAPRGVTWRTAMRRLKDLVDAGYLAHLRLDGARCVYHLTPKALALTPDLAMRAHSALATTPPDRQAMYCWLRSSCYGELVAAGWNVGNDPAAVFALRRFNIDDAESRLAELGDGNARHKLVKTLEAMRGSHRLKTTQAESMRGYRWRCRGCGAQNVGEVHQHRETGQNCAGPMRAIPSTPLDIAWKETHERYDVMILFVDNPSLPLEDQVKELSRVCYQEPVVPVIARSSDPRSRFDVETRRWVEIGARHRAMNKALGEDGVLGIRGVRVVDLWPTLQAYPVRDRLHRRRGGGLDATSEIELSEIDLID